MPSTIDLASSYVLSVLACGALAGHALLWQRARSARRIGMTYGRSLLVYAVGPIADLLIELGVSASAVTACALALCVPAAVLAAMGHFGAAALVLVVASLADGVDGLVARRTETATAAGALFDAAVDRYGETLFIGGVAVALRNETCALVLALLALLGGFMISYGSAKAEAFRVKVPGGPMRRGERAAWIVGGAALTPVWGSLIARGWAPAWTAHAPVVVGLAAIAVVGNLSAAWRLRAIAIAASPHAAPASPHADDRASVAAE